MEQTSMNKPLLDQRKAFSAIDIGTTKIVALTGYKNEHGQLIVLGRGLAPSKGVSRGEVINIESTVQSIKEAIDEARAEAGFFCKKVVVGIAGKHVHCTQNRGGLNRIDPDKEITEAELQKLHDENRHVNLAIDEKLLHAIPQSYTIDNEHEVTNPIGMRGRRIEATFHVVIAKETPIRYIKTAIQRCGLEVEELMLEPLASGASTLTNEEKQLGVAIVDIGGGTTDVAIYHKNIVKFTEVIPFGGNAITNDISVGCSILENTAESLKMQYGCTIQDYAKENEIISIPGVNGRPPKEISLKNLAGIIQARMEEIIDSALFVIKTSGYSKQLGAGIVVTGGGALMQYLPQLLSFKIGIDSKIGTPIHYINYKNSTEFNNPIYATSVGLLLHAAELHAKRTETTITETVATKQAKTTQNPIATQQPTVEQKGSIIEEPTKAKRKSLLGGLGDIFFGESKYTDTKIN